MNETQDNKRSIVKMLRSHGITPTAQRVKIASAMFARPQHLTADQIMQMVNNSGRRVSKATVYNTLGLFAEKGLLKELTVDASRAFYDSTTHNHHHFFNQETQEMSDIQADDLDISLPDNLPEGTEIDHVEMVVYLRNKS